MKTHLFATLAASAFALAVMAPPPAQADAAASAASTSKKHARHHPRMVRRAPEQHQIACTILGCNPIPSNCHPQMGYYEDGIPTGFDVVMCR